jgi:hypothetical protein
MADDHQQSVDAAPLSLFDQLRPTISSERLGTYLTASGFDTDRALRLYVWNAKIGEAFHFGIQAVEVGIRNCVNKALCARFGADWWGDNRFLDLIDRERGRDLATAKQRIENRDVTLCTAQIVANLSFGFWVGLLQPRYNPDLWSYELRSAFPSLPDEKNRHDLATAAKRISDLRNRIWHHEPVMKMSLSDEFREVNILLGWICPHKAKWVRENSVVMALLRQRP